MRPLLDGENEGAPRAYSRDIVLRPEWKAEFEADCLQLTAERARKIYIWALIVILPALIFYDYPAWQKGLWTRHPMFAHLVIWRVSVCSLYALYVAVSYALRGDQSIRVRTIQAWAAIALVMLSGVWLSILSQSLIADVSIFAMCMFMAGSMYVVPWRTKLLVYPLSMVAVLVGIYLNGISPDETGHLIANGVALNAVSMTVFAIIIDRLAYRNHLRNFVLSKTLAEERERTERLLLNIMPASIAQRLKESPAHIVDFHDDVSVLFADVVGFTRLAAELPPAQLIQLLETLFKAFDDLADRYGVEKIKTVGDAYMAAAGVPHAVPDHVERVARMALAMLDTCKAVSRDSGLVLNVRVGIHSGPAISGVIAQKKFAFDLWGDTVNIASRMESHGAGGRIHVTEQVRQRLEAQFQFEQRGPLVLKGKGAIPSFFLICENAIKAA